MTVELLPLCGLGKQAILDGTTGEFASIPLPFYEYGIWFANGQQYTFPTGEARQQKRMTAHGLREQDTFVKADGVCLNIR